MKITEAHKLHKIKSNLFSISLALIALVGLAFPASTYAHAGINHEIIVGITEHTAAYRMQAQTTISEVRKKPDTRMEGAVADACSIKKTQLESIINKASRDELKVVSTLDAISTAVQGYYVKHALKIDGYDQAVAAVTAAQSAALIDTGVLGVLNRPIQCSGSAGLVDVIAFRLGTKTAAESIKGYKESLLSLITLIQNGDNTVVIDSPATIGVAQ